MNLPRWKCHKEVGAFKIRSIHIAEGGTLALLVPEHLLSSEGIKVSLDYIANHKPRVGGYYVLYDDGYESFSPPAVFEAGYTRLRLPSE